MGEKRRFSLQQLLKSKSSRGLSMSRNWLRFGSMGRQWRAFIQPPLCSAGALFPRRPEAFAEPALWESLRSLSSLRQIPPYRGQTPSPIGSAGQAFTRRRCSRRCRAPDLSESDHASPANHLIRGRLRWAPRPSGAWASSEHPPALREHRRLCSQLPAGSGEHSGRVPRERQIEGRTWPHKESREGPEGEQSNWMNPNQEITSWDVTRTAALAHSLVCRSSNKS